MAEIPFNFNDLTNTEQIEVTYTDNDNLLQDINTNVKFVSSDNFTVYIPLTNDFNMKCPQTVAIKFVLDNTLYLAETRLIAIKKVDKTILLTMMTPRKVKQLQTRRYYRVCMSRTCVLIAMDEDNNKDIFMANTIDVSAGGVLLYKLTSISDNKIANININNYKKYIIVLCLDTDAILNLHARCVRADRSGGANRYAFEFTDTKPADINTISKYVTSEQVKKLNSQQK